MPPHGRDRLSKIEDLKSKLSSKNFKLKIEHRDNFSSRDTDPVPESWAAPENKISELTEKFFMKTSFFKKFFIGSVIFCVLTIVYGFYMFFFGGNAVSNENIDIAVLGNTFTAGGEELPLQISITNKNALALLLVDLVLEYPKSSANNLSGEVERIRESLGTIPSGSVRNENVAVVLFGEQGSVRPIRIGLEYRVEGSNAIFVKERMYEVNINSTPINIAVDAPNEVSPNQDVAFNIRTTSNATKTTSSVLVRVDYPVGFQFISSKPNPSFGNNAWLLGDLPPGTERAIFIVGKMIDVFDGEEKTFKVWSGSQSGVDKSAIDTVFNSLGHTFNIKRPFLEAEFLMSGIRQREYAINSSGSVTGEIRWTNNLDTQITNLRIRAHLSGNALNKSSVTPDRGFYDSANDTITWDRNSVSEFNQVSPGASGSVSFSFSPLSSFSGSQGVRVDPTITVSVSVSGNQDLAGFESTEIKNSDSTAVKVISDVGFANKALYYSGPFVNTGPIPPKAETATTYTIAWSLSNSSNNITKGIVRSSVPSWVNFIGPVSPTGEDLVFNSSTREIVWNVGNISRGTGISSASREVFFRVSLSPSLAQVGTIPILINEAVLTGHDDFANVGVRVTRPSLSTSLVNDPILPAGGDRVVE